MNYEKAIADLEGDVRELKEIAKERGEEADSLISDVIQLRNRTEVLGGHYHNRIGGVPVFRNPPELPDSSDTPPLESDVTPVREYLKAIKDDLQPEGSWVCQECGKDWGDGSKLFLSDEPIGWGNEKVSFSCLNCEAREDTVKWIPSPITINMPLDEFTTKPLPANPSPDTDKPPLHMYTVCLNCGKVDTQYCCDNPNFEYTHITPEAPTPEEVKEGLGRLAERIEHYKPEGLWMCSHCGNVKDIPSWQPKDHKFMCWKCGANFSVKWIPVNPSPDYQKLWWATYGKEKVLRTEIATLKAGYDESVTNLCKDRDFWEKKAADLKAENERLTRLENSDDKDFDKAIADLAQAKAENEQAQETIKRVREIAETFSPAMYAIKNAILDALKGDQE